MKPIQRLPFALGGAEPLNEGATSSHGASFVYDQRRRLNVLKDSSEHYALVSVMMKSDSPLALVLDVTTYMTEARGEGDRPD